ncbi:MAG: phosphoribosylformylglycinamidine cyclo-ligase [Candidatus Eutrophobiaceae bacterium]
MPLSSKSNTYRDAGVDLDKGNALVGRISQIIRPGSGVISNPGGFAALFDLSSLDYSQPVLVSSCDGVGTKLKLAIETGNHSNIGIDLVAMCVNDILALGARPLFFLDYYATGKLEADIATEVIVGIQRGCELSGCSLVGGETAEMPGMYLAGDYDLAGFCVGIVEKDRIIDGRDKAREGDVLIALASNGCHANGYSLIRRILAEIPEKELTLDAKPIKNLLLEPTRIYVAAITKLMEERFDIHALAHITGGGLLENLPRVLPDCLAAHVNTDSWEPPPIFPWLQDKGNISLQEMRRVFNCGVGMILCLPSEEADSALACLTASGEQAWQIGKLFKTQAKEQQVIFS